MTVDVKFTGKYLIVKAPYNADFNTALSNNDVKRKFDKVNKLWAFSIKEKDSVLKLLNDYYGTNYKNGILNK